MNDSGSGRWLGNLLLGTGAYLAGRAIVRRMRHFDLRDRLVLVTGGSRGLGLLLAGEFGRLGARVAICARDDDELNRARQMLGNRGVMAWTGACDITRPDQVEALVGNLRSDQGHVDVLVNNAGIIQVGPADAMTLDDYRAAMDANFWGAVYMTREVLPQMRQRRQGRIVNITSIGGVVPVPHLLPYVASKFALVGYSRGLRAELRRDGIYVSTIVPGLMRTGSPRNVVVKGQHQKEYAWFSIGDSLPLTSMSAQRAAERIAQACIRGESEVVLSWQAKLASLLTGIMPGTMTELLALTNRLLPAPGTGTQGRMGYQSESRWSRSFLTRPTDQAAVEHNEAG